MLGVRMVSKPVARILGKSECRDFGLLGIYKGVVWFIACAKGQFLSKPDKDRTSSRSSA